MHKKPGKLVKYLNSDSHHHWHHKTAVLSGVKLRLSLLTTRTPTNANLSLSDIYPDKDKALWLAGQLKLGQKIWTLSAVLDNKTDSDPARLKKKSCTIDKHDSLFVVKYASLGRQHWPMIKVIKHLQDLYKLKWLCPCLIFSRHTNLQEKLLRDLGRKVLWGVVDADFSPCPCNCPQKYKVNGECAYGGEHFSCHTAGSVYKILCNANNCNCFYIGKSQRYIKMRIQEHIGEVTNLYIKHILLSNQTTTTTTSTQLQGSTNRSSTMSLAMQSITSYQDLPQTNPMCVVIKNVPPLPPINLTMHLRTWTPSDVSNIDPVTVVQQPPIVHFENLPPTPKIPFYTRATTINHLN